MLVSPVERVIEAGESDTRARGTQVGYVQNPVSTGSVRGFGESAGADADGHAGGFVGERWKANRAGSLERFDIDHYVRMLETPAHKDWWWIGEQPGKWLESAVLTSAADPSYAAMSEAVRAVAARIIAAQGADGYLGITDPALRTTETPMRGMDPYEQYFTFHGLMTAYEAMGNEQALAAAVRLGDYYLRHIGPGKAEFWPSPVRPPENRRTIVCKQWTWVPEGTPMSPELHWQSAIAGHTAHYGWEGTLVIDPIMRLYELTGERRFLEFTLWVVGRIDEWSGWDAFGRLDEVAADTAGVHQLQPYVHSHTFHMNFLGFLRLYRATGDESLLRKVRGAWDDITRRQMYVTGGVSAGEHYKPGHERPLGGDVVETCANMSWMQLTQELLLLTGDPRFADVIERLLLNHVFASQTVDGDSYRYHTPPNGQKPARYFHGPDCCTSSGHRLVSMLPSFVYATEADGVVVNQYVSSAVEVTLGGAGKVRLSQATRYPEAESVSVQVACEPGATFAVRLRMPGWCSSPTVSVNGGPAISGVPGTYLELRRAWNPGDRVDVRLPMTVAWEPHTPPVKGRPLVALVRGPVVYALDTLWWNDAEVAAPAKVDESVTVPVSPVSTMERVDELGAGVLGPGYKARVRMRDGRDVAATFVPFANVGRWYREGEPRPDRESSAFSYAVWLDAVE